MRTFLTSAVRQESPILLAARLAAHRQRKAVQARAIASLSLRVRVKLRPLTLAPWLAP